MLAEIMKPNQETFTLILKKTQAESKIESLVSSTAGRCEIASGTWSERFNVNKNDPYFT